MGLYLTHNHLYLEKMRKTREKSEKMCPWPDLDPRTLDYFKSFSYSNCYAKIAKRYNSGEIRRIFFPKNYLGDLLVISLLIS